MKLVLANLASPANPGDQAILRGAVKLLRARFPGCELTAVTRAYSERAAYEAIGCRAAANYPDVECLAHDSTVKKILNVPNALMRPGMLMKAVREADLVLPIGGAYFYSYRKSMPGLTYLSHFSALALAKHYRKPVIFLPQSYGPFKSRISQEMFDWAVQKTDFIFFREEISGDWMRARYPGLGRKYRFMPDLAFNLERGDVLSGFKKNLPAGRVGVTIRAWEALGRTQEDYLETLVASLSRLHRSRGLKIRVIVQVQDAKKGEGDEWISEKLSRRLAAEIGEEAVEFCTARPYFKLSEICELYQQCDFLIGMRLHSALLSFIVGRPAIVAGYQHKAEGILKKLGLEGLYMGSFHELNAGAVESACQNMFDNLEMWSKKIETALANARGEIARTFEEKTRELGL